MWLQVRGYADSWVPPVGDGAWGAEPTYVGDGEKVCGLLVIFDD